MHKTWESLQHVHYPVLQFTRQVYPQSIYWFFVLKFLQVLVQPKSEAGTPDWEDAVSQSTKKSSVKIKATLSLCCNLQGSDYGNRSHVLVISVAPVLFSNETKQICAGQDCSNTSKFYFFYQAEKMIAILLCILQTSIRQLRIQSDMLKLFNPPKSQILQVSDH